MPSFIELTIVVGPADPHEQHSEIELDREGEDDGIVEQAPAPAATERTTKSMINVDLIRNFYPRKARSDGTPRIGTRITFANGSGTGVTETYEEVRAKLAPAIN